MPNDRCLHSEPPLGAAMAKAFPGHISAVVNATMIGAAGGLILLS